MTCTFFHTEIKSAFLGHNNEIIRLCQTIFFFKLQPDTPRYKWTITTLLYQPRRKKSLAYK